MHLRAIPSVVVLSLLALGACRDTTEWRAEPAPAATVAAHATPAEQARPAERAKPAARATPAETATPVARLLALAQSDNHVVDTARTIAKEHPKRLTGSKGYDAAASWAVAQFQSYGLAAHLEKWGEFPVAFDRGVQKGRIVSPAEAPLEFATMAWTAGTNGPTRGRAVLEPRTEEELAQIDAAVVFKGAWIVRTESKAGTAFKDKLIGLYDAAGIAGFVRASREKDLLRMGGNRRVDPKKLPTRVEVKLVGAQYDALVARLEKNEVIELEFDIDNRFTPGPVDCTNVVADLVGTRFPDEYVIVQGHFDAWDGAEGAQDNGTGTATTLEAARLIAKLGIRPLRTIRFVLYSGEEQGVFGSEGYVRDHKDELERISIVLTHDAGSTFLAGIDATYAMSADMHSVCGVLEKLDKEFPFEIHPVDALVNSGDSDHAPFIDAGVPAFFWHQSEKDYEHVHHTQFDTFDAVRQDELRHSAIVVAVTAFGFANLDHKLDRTDMAPLEPRRMGVQLDDKGIVLRVTSEGRAKKAGWQEGDKIVAIDGVAVESRTAITSTLQSGGSLKKVRIQRGPESLEFEFDYSNEKAEKERAERSLRRDTYRAAHPQLTAGG